MSFMAKLFSAPVVKPLPHPPSPDHSLELDGLRGIAILMVLIFHSAIFRPTTPLDDTFNMVLRSLWIGVDLFFVLSGFLITGILLQMKGKKGYFRTFYARRALRIFPLYYLVVLAALYLAPRLPYYQNGSLRGALHDKWWYLLYGSNFHFAQVGSLSHPILGPTWSLAIEEQFYLIWPIVVLLCSKKALRFVAAGTFLGAIAVRLWLYTNHIAPITPIYVLPFTRMDALAGGALLAALLPTTNLRDKRIALTHYRKSLMIALFVSSLVMLFIGSKGLFNKKLPFMMTIGYSLTALWFTITLAWVLSSSPRGVIATLLRSKLLVAFGKYSYALYLFNRPLVGVVRDKLVHPNSIPRIWGSSIPGQIIYSLIFILISFVLAWLSWRMIERPFLRLKRYFPRKEISIVGTVGRLKTDANLVPQQLSASKP